MTKQSDKPLVVHMDIRKLKPDPETNLPASAKRCWRR